MHSLEYTVLVLVGSGLEASATTGGRLKLSARPVGEPPRVRRD
jgi:hypothetical protein